jgi:hypothetical protein
MTVNPHPYVLTVAAELRHREVLALVARERNARQGAVPPGTRHPAADHGVRWPVARVLAVLGTTARRCTSPVGSIQMSCQ